MKLFKGSLTLALACASAYSASVVASFPQLVSGGTYVNVDMRVGNQNQSADQMGSFYSGGASPGQAFSGGEGQKLCARRENYPGQANSGYGSWYCATGTSGIQVGQPQKTSF